jgi:D-tyrosyl-tRNA(Tyr) deacylase
MRACLQRVTQARVMAAGQLCGEIARGLLVLLGVATDDTEEDIHYLVNKILNLRIFPDDAGQMNRSVLEVGGELLIVSQFTLYGDCRKGRRPSFIAAAPPEKAEAYYEQFIRLAAAQGASTAAGKFRAQMEVELINSGPVTIWIDSRADR